MFKDEVKIRLKAGNGGNGCVSFRREKFVAKGGPDGGDGGNGGDIILKVNPNINTLGHLISNKIYKAKKGDHGKGKKMHGKNSDDFIIEVPLGTVVLNEDKSEIIADLSSPYDQKIIAKGGIGGLGNTRFKTSVRQIPRFAEWGEPGEEKTINLELKLVADIGIIGLPSAGKSTLISVISNAKPKIAEYHFTTLVPNLGVVNLSKFGGSKEEGFVVADIPGLIEGASSGKGLGHQFLKHVSRTKLLIHLLDASEEDIVNNYKTIRSELQKYDEKLSQKEEVIALNKIDLLNEEDLDKKVKEIEMLTKSKKIFKISAVAQTGLEELIFHVMQKLNEEREKEKQLVSKKTEAEKDKKVILKPHIKESSYSINSVSEEEGKKTFQVSGKRISQMVVMTDLSNLEGLERIYYYMDQIGLQKSLIKKGANLGDKIEIKGKTFPFRP